ncbi:MAG: winged helix-turn-helix transcriptional regulator [Okeania sp. SIO3I5]|uniref:winged helix-turn-helix transcriptional regulator n=1 Tax=Okeania sp. SIO3I5 TaxID=2607805 RepID=UPI0013BDE134|nr:winged helix-turn-helix transcriptional regulator [Okeania sp. SIO3I5]
MKSKVFPYSLDSQYSLTFLGKSFQPMINEMHEWGIKHLNFNEERWINNSQN